MTNITLPNFEKLSFVLTGDTKLTNALKQIFEQGRTLGYREGQENWWAVQDQDEIWIDAICDGTKHTTGD